MIRFLKIILAVPICFVTIASAQTRVQTGEVNVDPRGEVELTVCSQNLENYGVLRDVQRRDQKITAGLLADKEKGLVQRFIKAECDVIAVQELLGKTEDDGNVALTQLALALRKRSNRFFEVKAGPSNDKLLRVGFLVAKDRADIVNSVSYVGVELPKLTAKEKPRYFSRGPLEIQLNVKPRGESFAKTVSLVTFHFKSQAGGQGDPTGLEWETYRMEMAEALRRVVESRHSKAFTSGESIVILLGDRNANFDLASAKILEGVLTLKNFQGEGQCRLSKRGIPLCQAGVSMNQLLFSVLTLDPQTKRQFGTFMYKNIYSWLDEILMPSESLRFANTTHDGNGDYDSGVLYEPRYASDHALVYVRLNW